jgi:CARDB protein
MILPKIYIRHGPKTRFIGSRNCLKRPLVLLLIPLLAITGLYVAPGIIAPAHADGIVGKVCIAATTATACPPTSPTIPGPSPGLKVYFLANVLVDSSDALSSFDITVHTDSSVLNPAGVVPGTLLANTHEVVKCIGGVNKIGTSQCPTTDDANTIEYAVSGDITSRPITGLLFKANFTVVANSANTPITFQTGCTGTSVPGGVCVTIQSGANANDPETSQTAKFSNLPYFDLIPSSGTLQVSKGDIDLSGSLTITSLNGLGSPTPATVNLSGSSSPSGPIFTVSPNSVTIAPGSDGLAGLNVTIPKAVIPGNYTLTVTGTSGALPPNSITILLIVPKPDFVITPNPSRLFFNVTVSSTSTIAVSSIGNFNGTVTLSAKSSNPLGLNATLQKKSLFISSKGTNTTLLTVKPTIAGVYSVNITITSGPLIHFSIVSVNVVDFFMKVANSVLNVVNDTSSSEPIDIPVTDVYNVTVTITSTFVDLVTKDGITGPSGGLNVTCTPTILTIISTNGTNGRIVGTSRTNCNVQALAIGSYIVTVVAMSGSGSRTSTHAVTFPVTVIAPSFSIVLSATVTTVPVSSSTTLNVKIVGNLGLKDNITIGLGISGGNLSPLPAISQNITIAYLTSTSPNATVLVTITTSSTTPPGFYTLTISGSGIHSTPTHLEATVLVIVVAIASPHDLAVYSVSPSATSATLGDDVTISIEVQNLGKLTENATIVAIVGDQSIGNKNVTSLAPGQNVNVTITWHTTGFSPGAYMIGGKVLQVTGETNLSNNLLRSATPLTLNAANTSLLQSSYVLPIAVIAAIIVIAAVLAIYFLPRRKPRVA